MAGGGVDFYTHHEWYDNVMAIFEYHSDEGVGRGFCQVQTTTSNGGFYENFMGEDGTLVISEVPQRGNQMLKEPHVEEDVWQQLVEDGMLLKAEVPAPDPDDAFIDSRVSPPLASNAWGLPVERVDARILVLQRSRTGLLFPPTTDLSGSLLSPSDAPGRPVLRPRPRRVPSRPTAFPRSTRNVGYRPWHTYATSLGQVAPARQPIGLVRATFGAAWSRVRR